MAGKVDRKKGGKSDVAKDGAQNESQEEVSLTNTAVSNRIVVLMRQQLS